MLLGTIAFNSIGAWGTLAGNLADAVAIVSQVANLHFFSCKELHMGVCGNSGVYWSLAVEEQFYLILPMLYMAVGKRFVPALLVVVLVQFFLFRQHTLWAYIRSDALAFGVLLAILAEQPIYKLVEPLFLRNRVFAIVASTVVIFMVLAMSSDVTRIVPFLAGMVALLCSVLVFIASYDRDYIFPVPFVRPFLIWLGTRSYAVYLIHIPAIFFTREIWHRFVGEGPYFSLAYALPFTLTAIPLTLGLAEINYRFIEVPFRERGKKLSERLQSLPDGAQAPTGV